MYTMYMGWCLTCQREHGLCKILGKVVARVHNGYMWRMYLKQNIFLVLKKWVEHLSTFLRGIYGQKKRYLKLFCFFCVRQVSFSRPYIVLKNMDKCTSRYYYYYKYIYIHILILE